MKPAKSAQVVALPICGMLVVADFAHAAAPSPAVAPASVIIASTALAGMRSIPLFDSRKIEFTVSSFDGCPADARQSPVLKELAHGTLMPKKSAETVTVPADTELAVFVEYTNASGGNSISCERALRFHSEPGKTYRVSYTRPHPWDRVSCDMTIVETRDGNELPVPSAHAALLEDKGFWKGSDLNICSAKDVPTESPPP